MAIEYGMTLYSNLSVTHLIDVISRAFSRSDSISDDEPGVIGDTNVEIRVSRVSESLQRAHFTKNPTAQILFRLNKFALPAGREDVARVVAGVLESVPGDMVLTWNWDTVIALRTGNDLVIRDDSDLVSTLVRELAVPYRVGAIPTRP